MAVTDWFMGLFRKNSVIDLDLCIESLSTEIYVKNLAIEASINLIANAVSKSEFLTFQEGKEKRGDNYYLFNVEPNKNKSASKFWRSVVHKLVFDNECLVVQIDGSFYVAESYVVDKYAFKEYIYKDVVVDGLELKKIFKESEIFHFELHNDKIKKVIDNLYNSYSELIAASKDHYQKNNSRRGKLKIPTTYPQTDEAQKDLENLLNTRFKRFFESKTGAVLPLTNGIEYEELISNIGVKGGLEGRDVRAFIDDIFDFVAISFQIPPQLLKGNVQDTDKAIDSLLTFCINPLSETLEDEINRKYYGKEEYLNRTYLKVDTSLIKTVNIREIANALDILLRSGGNSINDNLKILGKEPISEDWADTHFMTKNYEPINDRLKGGE